MCLLQKSIIVNLSVLQFRWHKILPPTIQAKKNLECVNTSLLMEEKKTSQNNIRMYECFWMNWQYYREPSVLFQSQTLAERDDNIRCWFCIWILWIPAYWLNHFHRLVDSAGTSSKPIISNGNRFFLFELQFGWAETIIFMTTYFLMWCGLSLTVEKSGLLAFKGRRWYGMCAFNKTLVVRKCHLAPNPLGHIKYLRVILGRTCIIRNHQRSGKFESELIDQEISKRMFGQRQHLTLMKMPLQIIVA